MFYKAVEQLKKIRKFVDCRMIENQENNFISNNLENVSFELTLAINDLIRVDKILNPKGQQNGIQPKNMICPKKQVKK